MKYTQKILFGTVAPFISLVTTTLLYAQTPGPVHTPPPRLKLQKQAQGNEALEILGDNLPIVARAYGKSAAALADIIKNDPSLVISRHGRLMFSEQGIDEINGGTVQTDRSNSVPEPELDTTRIDRGTDQTDRSNFPGSDQAAPRSNEGTDQTDRSNLPEVVSDAARMDGGTDQTDRSNLPTTELNARGYSTPDHMTTSVVYPISQTFLLHSRPGSNREIFLDFDGHIIKNSYWNDEVGVAEIIAPPWSTDADPTFSDNEKNTIQNMWKRIADDYAIYDVDVTTEFPGESALTRSDINDQYFGIRILISPIASAFPFIGLNGGWATVGVFNEIGDYNKLPIIFSENLGNNSKYIAEGASHEIGHTLGLFHDGLTTLPGGIDSGTNYYSGHGTGATSWVPLMGKAYQKSITHWSKGEYPNANNQEDDIMIMSTYGLNFAPDDHGDTAATSTQIPIAPTVSAHGIINSANDKDVFKFSTQAGAIALTVTPAEVGPNLDVLAELYKSSGEPVAIVNPLSALNAPITATVSAGDYFLYVRSTGLGDLATGYSNYGSIGSYTITGTVIQKRQLTVTKPGNGNGTVTGKIGTKTVVSCGVDCNESADLGATVVLTAAPSSDSLFSGWSGACSGATTSCTVTMDQARDVQALFILKTFSLQVVKSGTGNGVVSGTNGATTIINCGSDCAETLNINTVVTLTVQPDSNTDFIGWSGACTGTGSCAVTMSGAKSVTATFSIKKFLISATKVGNGSGTVTGKIGTSSVIKCGTDCTENAAMNSTINFTAAPTSTSLFVGWSGACSGTGTCAIAVSAPATVTAQFILKTFTLTVTKAGSGVVRGTLGTTEVINCGSDCSESAEANTVITLTAEPSPGYSFTGWSGGCTGTAPCAVSLTASKNVKGTFALVP